MTLGLHWLLWVWVCAHSTEYTRRLQTTRKSWFFLPCRSQGWNSSRWAWCLFPLSHITGPYCISSKKKKKSQLTQVYHWLCEFHILSLLPSIVLKRLPALSLICFIFPSLELQEPAWAFSFLKELYSLTINFILEPKKIRTLKHLMSSTQLCGIFLFWLW